jgi:hypothetical protein
VLALCAAKLLACSTAAAAMRLPAILAASTCVCTVGLACCLQELGGMLVCVAHANGPLWGMLVQQC